MLCLRFVSRLPFAHCCVCFSRGKAAKGINSQQQRQQRFFLFLFLFPFFCRNPVIDTQGYGLHAQAAALQNGLQQRSRGNSNPVGDATTGTTKSVIILKCGLSRQFASRSGLHGQFALLALAFLSHVDPFSVIAEQFQISSGGGGGNRRRTSCAFHSSAAVDRMWPLSLTSCLLLGPGNSTHSSFYY